MVLDWAIQLENAGVIGSGISFRPEEIERAQTMTVNIGGNFAGNLGSNNAAGDINQNVLIWSKIAEFAKQIKEALPALEKDGIDTVDLAAKIAALQSEVGKSTPDQGVARGLLTDVRNAVSGAAGSLLASGIISQATTLLGG